MKLIDDELRELIWYELGDGLNATDVNEAVQALKSLYLTHRNTELEKLLEHKEKMHPCSTAYECFEAVPVSAIQSLMKKGE